MLKRFRSFFKAPWLCTAFSKLVIGLAAAVTVIDYIKNQLDGSPLGEKVGKTLDDVSRFLGAALNTVQSASSFVCGTSPNINAMSVEQALADLNSISKELGEL